VRASRIGAVLAHPVGRALTYELGDAAARLRVDGALPTVVAKVPVVGVIGTGYSVHADTRAGMSTTEAVAKNTTVLAAGSAASGLTTTGLVALGFTGGPVVGGAVVSGVVVAAGVGYAWDHREQIADKAEDVADGVRHVALDAGLTATDVADAVRDVALDAGLTATDVAGEAADAVDVVENAASSASAKAGDLVDTVVPDVDLRW
jgi:hypothetical protein